MNVYENDHTRICYDISEGMYGECISIHTALVEPKYRMQGRYRKALDDLQQMYGMRISLEAFRTLVPMYEKLGFHNNGLCHPDGYYEMVREFEIKEQMVMNPKDYVIGTYGADMEIPYCYKEINTGVTPNCCVVAILNDEQARYIRNHLERNYGSVLDRFSRRDTLMEDHYHVNYEKKHFPYLRIVDSLDNLSFMNFALYRSSGFLDTNHILISPCLSKHVRLETFLSQLDRYLFSHGLVPERFSKDTAEAVELEISLALERVNNQLSGIYGCSHVALSGGRTLVGFDKGMNGTVDCFMRTNYASFSGNGSMIGEVERIGFSKLKECDLIKMRPFLEEFCVRFKNYMPAVEDVRYIHKQTNVRSVYNSLSSVESENSKTLKR